MFSPFLGHQDSLTGGPVFGVHYKEKIKILTDKQLILVEKTPGDRMETHEFKRVK